MHYYMVFSYILQSSPSLKSFSVECRKVELLNVNVCAISVAIRQRSPALPCEVRSAKCEALLAIRSADRRRASHFAGRIDNATT